MDTYCYAYAQQDLTHKIYEVPVTSIAFIYFELEVDGEHEVDDVAPPGWEALFWDV